MTFTMLPEINLDYWKKEQRKALVKKVLTLGLANGYSDEAERRAKKARSLVHDHIETSKPKDSQDMAGLRQATVELRHHGASYHARNLEASVKAGECGPKSAFYHAKNLSTELQKARYSAAPRVRLDGLDHERGPEEEGLVRA